jgi:hypothetical protein
MRYVYGNLKCSKEIQEHYWYNIVEAKAMRALGAEKLNYSMKSDVGTHFVTL